MAMSAVDPAPLSVLIVGCGDIAGGYDEKGGGEGVLTHAGAYRAHPGFTVTACIDPDEARRAAFSSYWGIGDGFSDLAACRQSGMCFDIASVCVPTENHHGVLTELSRWPLRAVFAEKPLGTDLARSEQLVSLFAAADIPLAVNYFRRWVPGLDGLRRSIAAGEWGRLQAATGLYAKGLLNCGSHMIDLVQFLFGDLTPERVLDRCEDYRVEDPTLSAVLRIPDHAPLHLLGVDSRDYFVFELDLVMEKGRITIEDLGDGIRTRDIALHPVYVERRTLTHGTWRSSDMGAAMLAAVDNIHRCVRGEEPLRSDGRTALAAEAVCLRLMEMA